MRTWLHQRLVNDDELTLLLGRQLGETAEDSVFASHSLEGVPRNKPFIVHSMGNDTNEGLSDDSSAHRQFSTIYVHDEGQDYDVIDLVIARLKELLNDAPGSAEFGVITCHYLETSQDLEDDQMGTIVRYARFQIIGA